MGYAIAQKEWENIDKFVKKIRSRILEYIRTHVDNIRLYFGEHACLAKYLMVCLCASLTLAITFIIVHGSTPTLSECLRYSPKGVYYSRCYYCEEVDGQWNHDTHQRLFKDE